MVSRPYITERLQKAVQCCTSGMPLLQRTASSPLNPPPHLQHARSVCTVLSCSAMHARSVVSRVLCTVQCPEHLVLPSVVLLCPVLHCLQYCTACCYIVCTIPSYTKRPLQTSNSPIRQPYIVQSAPSPPRVAPHALFELLVEELSFEPTQLAVRYLPVQLGPPPGDILHCTVTSCTVTPH